MKIGLWADNINFPSLPLMKLSAYHKRRGDNVKLIDNFCEYFDTAYCSITFNLPKITKIPALRYFPNADKIHIGGSGTAITVKDGREAYNTEMDAPLDDEIEHIFPDYSLYPDFTRNHAYGFLTRGCPNACGFCIVSVKEGRASVKVAELPEFWNGQKTITLMDANILACKDREPLLESLATSGAEIDYTQGLDARFIDEDAARLICRTNIKMAHFAFDLMKNERTILRGLRAFRNHFQKTDRQCRVYILTNYDTSHEEDWYRVKKVIELGFAPDVRVYRRGTQDKFLTDLAHWANRSIIYRSCTFEDFVPRSDGKRCGELYHDILKS